MIYSDHYIKILVFCLTERFIAVCAPNNFHDPDVSRILMCQVPVLDSNVLRYF